jgi:citrate lyase subunit beta/citryl-CoA lyase
MIAAYDDAIQRGIGAVTFEGKMIDVPVVERAKAMLALAERFAARHSSRRGADPVRSSK